MHVLTLRLTREVFVGPKGDFDRGVSDPPVLAVVLGSAVIRGYSDRRVSVISLEWNGSIGPSLRLSNSIQSNLLVGPYESPWVKDPKPSR